MGGVAPGRGRQISRIGPEDEGLNELLPTEQELMVMNENLMSWLNNLGAEPSGRFESLPLRRDVLTFLDYPDRQSVPFEPFADRLIAESRLEWHSQDQCLVQMINRGVIELVVIDPMTRFGILECNYHTDEINGHDYKKLDTIRLTATGKAILTLMNSSSTAGLSLKF